MRRSTALLAAVACCRSQHQPRLRSRSASVLSITGPGAAQGTGYKNAVELLPAEWPGRR